MSFKSLIGEKSTISVYLDVTLTQVDVQRLPEDCQAHDLGPSGSEEHRVSFPH